MIFATGLRFQRLFGFGLLAILNVTGSTGSAAEIQLNGHTFTLPDGFEIEVAAKAPLVTRPITADFDERGRLYVADSSGSNEKPEVQVKNPTHRIVRLEDTNGDGVYDKSVVYADKFMFPEGTLWYDGSLYVSAPPEIWKLTDKDDDGVADVREVWFDGKTLTGCANDLHGPYLGLDGWIYWAKGAFAEQTHAQRPKITKVEKLSGGSETTEAPRNLVTKAAHIFRRKADGTGIVESVMTGGMDNPVDVVFMPSGERIFTTTFLQRPGGGLRDGLIHAVYGGLWGKVHEEVYGYHPRTGELMPALVHMGPAAPCGLTRYESSVFGNDYRDNLFACQFNMHKVSRHILEQDGATFKPTTSDFLGSSSLDFHPTDVLEDADGSLVVNDTGGWYTLCCPTSQLTKPDILGAIYRVRRKGATAVEDPRGLKLDWNKPSAAELVQRLVDHRPALVSRSMQALAKKGAAALPELKKPFEYENNPRLMSNAIWTLTRIDHPGAREIARVSTASRFTLVREVALHSVSLWRDRLALPNLTKLIESDAPPSQKRIAAEAIGRLEDPAAIPSVLKAASKPGADRFLQHALTYALIEIGQPIDLSKIDSKLRTSSLEKIVTIANDQMPGGKVDPQNVVPWLTSKDPILKETGLWLVRRHADWGDALAGYLRDRLSTKDLPDADRIELIGQLAQFSTNSSIQQLLASTASHSGPQAALVTRHIVLEAMRGSPHKELPASWLEPLTMVLAEGEPSLVPLAIGTIRAIPVKGPTDPLKEKLLQVAGSMKFPESVRVEALAAIPDGVATPELQLFQLLADNLKEEVSVSTRSAAVEALVKSKLETTRLSALADSIPFVGPLELNRLLGAFEHCADEAVGMKLIAALKASPVLTSLRVDSVKQRLQKFPSSVQAAAEELYAAINIEAGRQQEKLDEMMASLSEGDIRRGQLVFNSQKAACSACHAMGYMGGNIGPDLSKIGKIRSERDLLEAVLFPSVSFVRSYEPILIVTKSGKQVNGLIRKETPDEITVATGAREEARIMRADIDEIRPSTVSVMPAGLDTQLTRQQIADLIAFLKAKQ